MLKRRLLFGAGAEASQSWSKPRRKKLIATRALQNKRIMYPLLPSPAGGNSYAERRLRERRARHFHPSRLLTSSGSMR